MVTRQRPAPLDLSLSEKSLQEQADEEFVNGVLGLGSQTSRGRALNKFESKYGRLTTPTGELSDSKYIKTNFGAVARLPHQKTTASATGTTSSAPATSEAGVVLLQSLQRNRGRLQHHRHMAALHREQEQQHRGFDQMRAQDKNTLSADASETASLASFGTSTSQASTRVIKEPLRPSWMPLRAGKGMNSRRIHGAGLLHVAGRTTKDQLDTSLRDKYETPRPASRKNSPGGGQRPRRDTRAGITSRAPTGSVVTVTGTVGTGGPTASAGVLGLAKLDGVDDAKELRRAFKLHLHTLPTIESVKMLDQSFETAALFRKPSLLTDAERQHIFSKLAALRHDATTRGDGLEQIPSSQGKGSDVDGDTMTGRPVSEEIQSRFERLSALAARAEKAGFR